MTYPTECPNCQGNLTMPRELPIVHTMDSEGELMHWIKCPLCSYLTIPELGICGVHAEGVPDSGPCNQPRGHTGLHLWRTEETP